MLFLSGAILFGIHSDDLSDEITDLMLEMECTKLAIWKQMRVVEIVAAVLAERLMEGGTQFLMEPDRVLWPDGTVTKKAAVPRAKKGLKKVTPATSKHGLYGVLVAQYGKQKKNVSSEKGGQAESTNSSVIVLEQNTPSNAQASTADGQSKPKQARRGKVSCFQFFMQESKSLPVFYCFQMNYSDLY